MANSNVASRAPRSFLGDGLILAGFLTLVVGSVVVALSDVSREVAGASALVLMLALLTMRMHVGVALAIPGALMVYATSGWEATSRAFKSMPYDAVASWSLSVIPLFIFMGLMLWRSGVTETMFGILKETAGRVPGGLAIATNFAGAGLSSVSGSTLGITYALARIGIPEMLRAGYDKRLATGAVLMAGTGGQMIPPSIMLVVYAGVAGVPVGHQLLAGIIPGVALTLIYAAVILTISLARPSYAPRTQSVSMGLRKRLIRLAGLWPVVALMVLVLGGIYGGIFTATEAGGVGAIGAILISILLMRREVVRGIMAATRDSVSAVGSVFLLIAGASILNRGITLSGIPRQISGVVAGFELGRVELILVLIIVYVILGMFMDPLTILLVTVPILLPTANAVGISSLWFGVFVVLLGEVAILTPPMGILSFIVHRICAEPDVSVGETVRLADVFMGALWFIPATIGLLLLLTIYPDAVGLLIQNV